MHIYFLLMISDYDIAQMVRCQHLLWRSGFKTRALHAVFLVGEVKLFSSIIPVSFCKQLFWKVICHHWITGLVTVRRFLTPHSGFRFWPGSFLAF